MHTVIVPRNMSATSTALGALLCVRRGGWPTDARQHKSEAGQDAFLDEVVFEGASRGVYLDIGCNDGITGSNSFLFARRHGWSGLCVEADPAKYAEIASASGRTDQLNVAVSNQEGSAPFIRTWDKGGGLSGLAATLNMPRAREFKLTSLRVPTITPNALLQRHFPDRDTIDVVSIDIEGAEASIMRVWPFDSKWCVSTFVIENSQWCNSSNGILPELRNIFRPHGYRYVREIGADEVFLRQPPCPNALALMATWAVIRERAVVRYM